MLPRTKNVKAHVFIIFDYRDKKETCQYCLLPVSSLQHLREVTRAPKSKLSIPITYQLAYPISKMEMAIS